MAANEEIFDREAAVRRLGGDEGFYQELASVFCMDAPVQIDMLIEAVEAGEFENAHRIAHSLKSSSRTLGALSLGELFARIERCLVEGERHPVEDLVGQVRREFPKLTAQLGKSGC